ncbi:MAG: ATP-binding protein [Sphingomonas fennica]
MGRGATAAGAALAALAGGGGAWMADAPAAAAILGALLPAGLVLALRRPRPAPAAPPSPTPEPPRDQNGLDPLDPFLAALSDPLLVVVGQMVVRANPAALTLFGAHIVGEDVRIAIRHPLARPLLAPGAEGRAALTGLGGSERRWELTVSAMGQSRRLAHLRDRSEADKAERIRVDFVANASHELRTPLATLIGFIETLEDANGADDAPVRTRFLTVMMGEARRMQRLIDDLISLSRIEADRYSPPQDAVDLTPLLREVADVTCTRLGEARDRLALTPPEGALTVTGDRVQLQQMMHNLIGNALKYGGDGAVTVALARTPAGQARLTVEDRGDGIAPEHLPRLTERFYRVDPGRSRAVGGTGLGLSIVKHIIERHKGRLDIASTVNVGTTVTVLLPLADARPPPS